MKEGTLLPPLRIIREYYEQMYTQNLDNPDDIDKFLEIHILPKLTQEKTENLNRFVTSD